MSKTMHFAGDGTVWWTFYYIRWGEDRYMADFISTYGSYNLCAILLGLARILWEWYGNATCRMPLQGGGARVGSFVFFESITRNSVGWSASKVRNVHFINIGIYAHNLNHSSGMHKFTVPAARPRVLIGLHNYIINQHTHTECIAGQAYARRESRPFFRSFRKASAMSVWRESCSSRYQSSITTHAACHTFAKTVTLSHGMAIETITIFSNT